jgi:hypothetical protein
LQANLLQLTANYGFSSFLPKTLCYRSDGMNASFAQISVRLGLCLTLLGTLASRQANAQISGLFQSTPGTLATYEYLANGLQAEMLPVDVTLSFSNDNPTSMLSATIIKPIIGAEADGTPIFPIAAYFPMRVAGTSQDGQHFHGDLLGTQYLFDWQFVPTNDGGLLLNGRVYWAGGRYELTTIDNARFVPAVAGDYDRDGAVDAADYVVWRTNMGTSNALPNDPIGGTIGAAQYDQWRAHFGQTAGAGLALGPSTDSAIPEPASILMLVAGILMVLDLQAGRRAGRYR